MSSDALAIAELHAEVHTADASPRLPEGWAWASLGEILPLEYGKALPERLRDPTGKVAVYGSSGRVGWHTAAMIAGPTLIVGRKGSAGAVFYCNEDCWPIDTVYYTKPKGIIDLRYGFHFLKWRALGRLDQSTAIPSLSRDIYSDVAMPVAPLPEQRRIVVRIDELFAEIAEGEAALERARQGLDTWRRALFKAAVTGELTRDWREANRPTETGADLLARIRAEREALGGKPSRKRRGAADLPLDTSDLPALPEGWVWGRMGDIALSDGRNGISVKGSKNPPGMPALRLDALAERGIDYSRIRYIEISQSKAEALALREGDFLISRANGSEHLVGKARLVGIVPTECIYPDTIIRYRIGASPVVGEWLELIWESSFIRHQIRRMAKTTAGILKISQDDIRQIWLPIPPLAEIAQALNLFFGPAQSGNDASTTLEKSRKERVALRQSVLKAAFEGRLVPQDPADEPASPLLARLRNGHPGNGARRRRARAAADFLHPSLPGLTGQSVDPRVEPAGDE